MLASLGLWCPGRKGGVGLSLVDFLILQAFCEKSIPAGCDGGCDKGADSASGYSAGHGEGARPETYKRGERPRGHLSFVFFSNAGRREKTCE